MLCTAQVLAAVKDEASDSLTVEAVAALRSLGGSEDLRGRYRASHLIIVVKGAPPGTAFEQAGYTLAQATIGEPPGRIALEIQEFSFR